METSFKNIEKLIIKKLEEQKICILQETEKLLKEQEKNFASIMSANLKILTERIEKIEIYVTNNKSNIMNIEKDLNDVKTTLNFQETNLIDKIKQIRKCYDNEVNMLTKKTIDLENRSRRNNLRIDGVKEKAGETWTECEDTVKDIFKNQLKINSEVVVERAHRVGKTKDSKIPRTIVLKLLNYQDKNKILNAVKNLKGTGVFINEDFAKETIESRKKLWEEVKRLRGEGKYAIINMAGISDFESMRFNFNEINDVNIDPDINYSYEALTDCSYHFPSDLEGFLFKNVYDKCLNKIMILHVNIRSLNNNFEKLLNLLEETKNRFNIVCLTETWISNNIDNTSNFYIPHFKLISFKRQVNKRGGGVIIYVNENIVYYVRNDLSASDSDKEILTIEIMNNQSKNILLSCILKSITDHFPIFLTINSEIKNKINKIKIRIFNHTNIKLFKNQLSLLHWKHINFNDNADKIYDNFYETFYSVYDANFPIIEKTIAPKYKNNPWITKGFKKSSKIKQKLYIKYLKTKSLDNEKIYKNYKHLFEKVRKNLKKNYYTRLLDKFKNNTKRNWQIMNEITGRQKKCSGSLPQMVIVDNKRICEPKAIAHEFNKFFTDIGPKLANKNPYTKATFNDFLVQMDNCISSNELYSELTFYEFEKAFKSLKKNKANGADDINGNIVIECFEQLKDILFKVYEASIHQGVFPDQLKIAKITPILKEGDQTNISTDADLSITETEEE
ncbi:uncharacterized protein MAL8P1.12 [Hydra vulgaris]|uniref:uncharacterized protein MAL8P1.12 n=1 Tax=Hydra vulgaris TaxID=6087 RepID=UPI0032EA8EC2